MGKSNEMKFADAPKPRSNERPLHRVEALAENDIFVVLEGAMRIVRHPTENKDGSMTGVLYRNIADYKNDQPMDHAFGFWL